MAFHSSVTDLEVDVMHAVSLSGTAPLTTANALQATRERCALVNNWTHLKKTQVFQTLLLRAFNGRV